MYNRIHAVYSFLLLFLLISCSQDTVNTEVYGDIEGRVIDAKTEEPIRNVSIATSPGTVAILTEEDGSFYIDDVPTGNYNITARKDGYSNASVSVAVRENRVATASITMRPNEEDTSATTDDLEANVTSWFNRADGDSMFVDVEYSVRNIGDNADIEEYEVYFEIKTDSVSFFYDVEGADLKKGQKRFREFSKYIFSATATDVVVLETWVKE